MTSAPNLQKNTRLVVVDLRNHGRVEKSICQFMDTGSGANASAQFLHYPTACPLLSRAVQNLNSSPIMFAQSLSSFNFVACGLTSHLSIFLRLEDGYFAVIYEIRG